MASQKSRTAGSAAGETERADEARAAAKGPQKAPQKTIGRQPVKAARKPAPGARATVSAPQTSKSSKTKKSIGSRRAPAEPAAKAKAAPSREPAAKARPREPRETSASAAPEASGPLREMAEKAGKRLGELFEEARTQAAPLAKSAAETTKKYAVDLEGGLGEAFGKVSEQARDLMAKGQHTRVRIKFRGRQLAELPIAAVAAAEVASFWWFGPLRLLLGHVVGKAVLDVEFVSNADAHVLEGRAQLADGELELALASFDLALRMDRRHAPAWLGRGVALKLRGDKPAARAAFEKAEQCDPHGESGAEARRYLDKLGR